MRAFSATTRHLSIICLLGALSGAMAAQAPVNPASRPDAGTLEGIPASPDSSPRKQRQAKKPAGAIAAASDDITVTVRPNDTIERLLIRDCGLTREETAPFAEEVRKRNKILNIRRLYAGQEILVPRRGCPSPGRTEITAAPSSDAPPAVHPQNSRNATGHSATTIAARQGDQPAGNTAAPATKPDDPAGNPIALLRPIWEHDNPARQGTLPPLTFTSGTFSLSLDPARYPVFFAMDGSRILIDQRKSIPPRYLSLMAEQEPTLRVVTESPANGRRFLAALLGASRFYSVEENFTLAFGADPKLTVRSDFRVERTAESLFKSDVLLVNAEKTKSPPVLAAFLKKEGFVLHEPFSAPPARPTSRNRLVRVAAKTQPEIVDALLSALSLRVERDQHLKVIPASDSGIALSVRIERIVEHNGRRYAILCSGDPTAGTIAAILTSGGMQVVALEARDDFRTVAEKILTILGIRATYGFHQLWPGDTTNYSVQMSGILIEGTEPDRGSLFITDRELDGITRSLVEENGYRVGNPGGSD